MKIAAMLLISLALVGGGCASLSPSCAAPGPSTAQVPAGQSMTRDERADAGPLWYVCYWTMYFGGEVLAGR